MASTDVIFCRPRHDYESYRDFWKLVELSGYHLIYIDEIPPDGKGKTFIYSGPDAITPPPETTGRVIYWLAEWYRDVEEPKGVDEMWHIDCHFAREIGARFVPVGSHPDLGRMPRAERRYDTIHLSYAIPRRQTVYDEISRYGLYVAPNGWDDERDRLLAASRSMIHVHQHDDIPALAPLRAAIAAAYYLPLFAERHWEVPHIPAGAIISASHENLAKVISERVRRKGLQTHGDYLHDVLCNEYRFDKVIEGVI